MALAPQVDGDQPAEPARLGGDRHDLVAVRVRARGVDQAERDSPRARLHASGNLASHGAQFVGAGCPLGSSQYGVTHRTMRDERAEADGGTRTVQGVQVLADGSPGPLGGAPAFRQSKLCHPIGQTLVRHRRRAQPVRVDELGREALEELRREDRILERTQSAVGVHVHEPGAEGEAVQIDGARGRRVQIRGHR